MTFRINPLVFALIFTSSSFAGKPEGPQPEQLSWLTGCWHGTGLGGKVQECWLKSPDNRFTSVFQMIEDGKQRLSEIVMIAEFDGKPGMRAKHFDPDFNQWESDKIEVIDSTHAYQFARVARLCDQIRNALSCSDMVFDSGTIR